MADNDTKPQEMNDEMVLLAFVDELIAAKKDPSITQDNLPQVRQTLFNEVNDAINSHLVGLMSEDDQIELDKLLDEEVSDDVLNTFFMQKIPHLENEITSALINFREAYLVDVGVVGTALGGDIENLSDDIPEPPSPAPVSLDTSHELPADTMTEQQHEEALPMVMTPSGPKVVN